MKFRALVLLACLAVPFLAPAAEDSATVMREVGRAARAGEAYGVEAVSRVHDAKAAALVLDLVDDKRVSYAMREQIAKLVAQWPAGPGLDQIVLSLQKKPKCSDEMLQFYTTLGLPALQPVFLTQLAAQKDKAPEDIKDASRHAAIVRALESFPDQRDTVVTHIISLLDDKSPHVLRLSAALTLGGLRSAASIPALVARVADRSIGEDAMGSLFRLTGQDFGNDTVRWNEWLAGEGKDAPLKMLTRDDLAKHRETQRAAAQTADNPNATFYGLELKGRHIIFVLDVSGSMMGERIDQLRGQTANLLNLLQTRSKTLHYAIITFASDVNSCADARGLMENDESSFKKASKFVERMDAGGQTAMVAALEHVRDKLLPGNNVDTIYFLSDGDPSDGSPENVMAMVSKIHFDHQIRFHTISITGSKPEAAALVQPPTPPVPPPPSLLEQMAKQTGGDFKAL
jgi:uncharacterized protein YegL